MLGKIAKGDEVAFEELFRAYSGRVFRFALGRLQDKARAEEIVDLTMFDLWRSAGKFRFESSFTTWLLGMARIHLLLAHRYDKRHHQEEASELIHTLYASAAEAVAPPSDALERQWASHELDRCMNQLNEAHRETVQLVYFEDMSMEEVAALTGVPVGTVKSRLFHAKKKLQACLQCVRSVVSSAVIPFSRGGRP